MTQERYERQERWFGQDGQQTLHNIDVTIVGIGGLGSHVAQQLAYLGVRKFHIIDADVVEESNLNRLIGAVPSDARDQRPKVKVINDLIKCIQPDATVDPVQDSFISDEGYDAIRQADVVFGCVDKEGARFVLSSVCAAYAKPYLDLATDVLLELQPAQYGGRVFYARQGSCLSCSGLLDSEEVHHDLSSIEERQAAESIYGVARAQLGRSGPSVVTLNGVVASLGVTEMMLETTGVRSGKPLLTYRANEGGVNRLSPAMRPDCPICATWGQGEMADTEKYIRFGYRERLL